MHVQKSNGLHWAFLLVLLLSILSASCKYDATSQYAYRPPVKINDGLMTGSLEEVTINEAPIVRAAKEIYGGRYREVHSMLIFKDGRLVFEEYFQGHDYQWDAPGHHGEWMTWNREMLHDIMSASKSITSACIGIAIDRGFIGSVRQSVFDYLPGHQHLRTGGKEKITIEHLLTMTAGLEWREWSAPYSSQENPCIGIWFQDKDPVSYILEKSLVHTPGTQFNYSTGNMHVLGEIIRNASGLPIDTFCMEYLLAPMGIDTLDYYIRFRDGTVDANSLKLTPRAMLKFGVTYLNKGTWKGKRIIPGEWTERSATPYAGNHGINVPGEPSGKLGYSYTWWTKQYRVKGKRINMYSASGFGGQHIMVLPEADMVVVFTGGNYLSRRPPFPVLEKYILPALDFSN